MNSPVVTYMDAGRQLPVAQEFRRFFQHYPALLREPDDVVFGLIIYEDGGHSYIARDVAEAFFKGFHFDPTEPTPDFNGKQREFHAYEEGKVWWLKLHALSGHKSN